ncbi:MAG TPA: peptidase, partial [Caulobacter sp.]|nr:peptidase [Caulobacter sp.]
VFARRRLLDRHLGALGLVAGRSDDAIAQRLPLLVDDLQRRERHRHRLLPTCKRQGAQVRAALVDYGRGLRKAKGDAADLAQARDLSAILLDPDPARLALLADSLKTAPRTPPGPPIGEDGWFGDLRL